MLKTDNFYTRALFFILFISLNLKAYSFQKLWIQAQEKGNTQDIAVSISHCKENVHNPKDPSCIRILNIKDEPGFIALTKKLKKQYFLDFVGWDMMWMAMDCALDVATFEMGSIPYMSCLGDSFFTVLDVYEALKNKAQVTFERQWKTHLNESLKTGLSLHSELKQAFEKRDTLKVMKFIYPKAIEQMNRSFAEEQSIWTNPLMEFFVLEGLSELKFIPLYKDKFL